MFSSSKTESQEFKEAIKMGLPVEYKSDKFRKVIGTFDKNLDKLGLLIYIHSRSDTKKLNRNILRNILGNPDIGSFINNNFEFYPILSSSKSLELIKQHISARDFPCLLFFKYDLEDKLVLIKKFCFDSYTTPDIVFMEANEVAEMSQQIREGERMMMNQIEKKKETLKKIEKENQKRIDQMFSQQGSNQNIIR